MRLTAAKRIKDAWRKKWKEAAGIGIPFDALFTVALNFKLVRIKKALNIVEIINYGWESLSNFSL